MADESNGGPGPESVHTDLTDLRRFTFERLLSDSPDRKLAVVQARVEGSTEPAVLVLEKVPFSAETATALLAATTAAQQEFTNDIYGQYSLQPPARHNTVKANVIHPATEKHLAKYLSSPGHLVAETPALHTGVTLPALAK
jgi:m7GpppX diphosphatase